MPTASGTCRSATAAAETVSEHCSVSSRLLQVPARSGARVSDRRNALTAPSPPRRGRRTWRGRSGIGRPAADFVHGMASEDFLKLYPEVTSRKDQRELTSIMTDSTQYILRDAVKKNPGAIKFAGGSSPGSMDHLAFCKVAKMVGVNPKDLSYVAFSGGGEALTTLLGGNVAFV